MYYIPLLEFREERIPPGYLVHVPDLVEVEVEVEVEADKAAQF